MVQTARRNIAGAIGALVLISYLAWLIVTSLPIP